MNNKLVPISKFFKLEDKLSFLSNVSIVADKNNVPLGFVFGRDSFISLLERIDEQFEKKAKYPKDAYNNLAGKLIDLIEQKLPINPEFIHELRESITAAQKRGWVSFSKIIKSLKTH